MGTVLTIIGLRARRVGLTPRCPYCEYNLSSRVHTRCPECGNDVPDEKVVYGDLRRNRGSLIAGLAWLLVPVLLLISHPPRINWYAVKPDSWLLNDCLSTSFIPREAEAELKRRILAGSFDGRSRQRLIERTLQAQQNPTGQVNLIQLVNFVGTMHAEGQLTDEQAQQFLRHCVRIKLSARSGVGTGEPLPLVVDIEPLLPEDYVASFKGSAPVFVNDQKADVDFSFGVRMRGTGSRSGQGCTIQIDEPGVYTISTKVPLAIFDSWSSSKGTQPMAEFEVLQETEVEILPRGDEATVKMSLPDNPDQLLQRFELAGFLPRKQRGRYQLDVKATQLPRDVAFEILARTAEGERNLGHIVIHKRDSTSGGSHGVLLRDVPVDEQFDLVFRASRQRARETVDLHEILAGELVFKDIRLADQQAEGDTSESDTRQDWPRRPTEYIPPHDDVDQPQQP
jgi:hypothetical protein